MKNAFQLTISLAMIIFSFFVISIAWGDANGKHQVTAFIIGAILAHTAGSFALYSTFMARPSVSSHPNKADKITVWQWALILFIYIGLKRFLLYLFYVSPFTSEVLVSFMSVGCLYLFFYNFLRALTGK